MVLQIHLNEEQYSSLQILKGELKLDNLNEVVFRAIKILEEQNLHKSRQASLNNKIKMVKEWQEMLKGGLDTQSKLYQDYKKSVQEIKEDKDFMKEQMEWEALWANDGID